MSLNSLEAKITSDLGGTIWSITANGVTIDTTEAAYSNLIGIAGGYGSDCLIGNAQNNIIWGGIGGNDTLKGGGGNDIYLWGSGSGNDVILADDFNAGDTIKFFNIADWNHLLCSQSGNDFVIATPNGDVLTVQGWFAPENANKRITNPQLCDPGQEKHLNIQFDYRFDTDGFYTPEMKQGLEIAASWWERYLHDDFTMMPAGTTFQIQNPNTPYRNMLNNTSEKITMSLNYDVDDIVIFMGSADNRSPSCNAYAPSTWAKYSIPSFNNDYGSISDYEPHVGEIVIAKVTNPTGNDLYWNYYADLTPENTADNRPHYSSGNTAYNDITTLAIHEIGHCLGINPGIPAMRNDLFYTNGQPYDGKQSLPVYLAGDNVRMLNAGYPVLFNMDTYVSNGFSTVMTWTSGSQSGNMGATVPSTFDLAMLADIGYEIR